MTSATSYAEGLSGSGHFRIFLDLLPERLSTHAVSVIRLHSRSLYCSKTAMLQVSGVSACTKDLVSLISTSFLLLLASHLLWPPETKLHPFINDVTKEQALH
jgi:hypothetical protein